MLIVNEDQSSADCTHCHGSIEQVFLLTLALKNKFDKSGHVWFVMQVKSKQQSQKTVARLLCIGQSFALLRIMDDALVVNLFELAIDRTLQLYLRQLH